MLCEILQVLNLKTSHSVSVLSFFTIKDIKSNFELSIVGVFCWCGVYLCDFLPMLLLYVFSFRWSCCRWWRDSGDRVVGLFALGVVTVSLTLRLRVVSIFIICFGFLNFTNPCRMIFPYRRVMAFIGVEEEMYSHIHLCV